MILYSKHARDQMAERGISASEVEEAIKCGSKELQKPNKILYHYRYFIIATKKINYDHFVITVMLRWKK